MRFPKEREMGAPAKMTFDQEAELLERFLAREPMAELTLVSVMRPLFRLEVRRHWQGQLAHMHDLRQGALLALWERRDSEEGRRSIRPPLAPLAKALIEHLARKLHRSPKIFQLREQEEPATPSSQEPMFELKRLLAISAALPRKMSETMAAHAAHMLGEGPPLHEALGIDRETARKRLTRAQAAVHRIAEGEKDEVQDESEDE